MYEYICIRQVRLTKLNYNREHVLLSWSKIIVSPIKLVEVACVCVYFDLRRFSIAATVNHKNHRRLIFHGSIRARACFSLACDKYTHHKRCIVYKSSILQSRFSLIHTEVCVGTLKKIITNCTLQNLNRKRKILYTFFVCLHTPYKNSDGLS